MKKSLLHVWLCSCLLAALVACGNKQVVAPAEGDGANDEVAFEMAKNYFFKNGQEIPLSPKISSECQAAIWRTLRVVPTTPQRCR
jgi:hypothetical protein